MNRNNVLRKSGNVTNRACCTLFFLSSHISNAGYIESCYNLGDIIDSFIPSPRTIIRPSLIFNISIIIANFAKWYLTCLFIPIHSISSQTVIKVTRILSHKHKTHTHTHTKHKYTF